MLRYTGGGYGGALPLVPARDLSDDDLKALREQLGGLTDKQLTDWLLGSGLYESAGKAKAAGKEE